MKHPRRSRRFGTVGVLAAAALFVAASPAAAQNGGDEPEYPVAQIVTTDGRVFSGELVEQNPDTVVLGIAGINTPFSRDMIESLEIGKTVTAEYDELKAELDPTDADAWAQIVEFLFDRGRYDAAKQEVEALLKVHPDYEVGRRLQARIESQILLIQQSATPTRTTQRPAAARPNVPLESFEPAPAQEANYWLTADQVNKLRIWELPADLSRAQPRVVVPRDVVDELFENYGDDPALPKGRDARNRFRAELGWQQLDKIFEVRARELYPRVRVVQDPPALQDFRGQLNPGYVVGYFRQHFGTGQIPGLYLLRYRPNTAESAFVNFLSLSNVVYEGDSFIDRDTPRRSLLLQWGLPRADADVPAPPIDGWRPFFTGLDDPRYEQYADWIDSLYEPMPDYGIEFTPPDFNEVITAEPATIRP
ncbi:MAG: tetratricopeptide repeat protein [Planctomycetota bacterium]